MYEKIADSIFRYCYFRVYDREIAKELSQEAFLRAWKYLSDGKEVKNLNALIYQITRNLIYDHREKTKKLVTDIEFSELNLSDKTNLHEEVSDKIEVQKLLVEIDKLDTESQELIVLRFVQGLKPREISKIVNQPVNNISVKINRAKKKLIEGYEQKNR